MRTRVFLFLLLLSWMASAAAGQSQQQKCQRACTTRSATGTYGYSCTGVAPNPLNNFKVEPFAAYGVVTSDGKGQWNGHGKVSFNGTVVPWTHDTRKDTPAVVNPDCTGSVTYEVTVGGNAVPDAHFEYVIVNDGLEVKGFPVDPGYAVSCQLIRESSSVSGIR
jgi:hypothetical protein